MGLHGQARRLLEAAYDRARVHYSVYFMLAILEQRAGRLQRAEALAREGLATGDPFVHYGYAGYLAQAGALDRAVQVLREQMRFPDVNYLWRHRPFMLGPLYDHPPFIALMAPRG